MTSIATRAVMPGSVCEGSATSLMFDETNPKTRVRVYRFAHLGLSILAVVGLSLAGPAMRKRLMPTIVTAAAIALFHTFTIVSARFHIPIEPLLAIWGAAGAEQPGQI